MTTAQPAASELESGLETRIARLLERRGLDPAAAECAIAELRERLDEDEIARALEEIRTGAPVPEPLAEAARAAGEACAG